MKIVIFGASGGTGRELVKQALARGHEVTVFVRDPAKLEFQDVRIKCFRGDAFDIGSVEAALKGQDAVISALGTHPPWRPTEICTRGTKNIIAGAQALGLRRLIVLSTLGANESRAWAGWIARVVVFKFILRGVLADKDEMERQVRMSDLDWTLVRPALLHDGPPRGKVRAVCDGSIGSGSIRRSDVAAFCLDQLDSDRFLREAPVIAT